MLVDLMNDEDTDDEEDSNNEEYTSSPGDVSEEVITEYDDYIDNITLDKLAKVNVQQLNLNEWIAM